MQNSQQSKRKQITLHQRCKLSRIHYCMNAKLSKLFKQDYIKSESRLSSDIWSAIQTKQAKSLKIQSLVYCIMGVLSLGGFVFMIFYTKMQFSSSGFFQYISLVFSDGNLFATYWKEYLLSLADSLPFASIGALLFLLFSMLISIKKVLAQQLYYKNKLLIN